MRASKFEILCMLQFSAALKIESLSIEYVGKAEYIQTDAFWELLRIDTCMRWQCREGFLYARSGVHLYG